MPKKIESGTPTWPFSTTAPTAVAAAQVLKVAVPAEEAKAAELDKGDAAGTALEHLSRFADPVDLSTTHAEDLVTNEYVENRHDQLTNRIRAQEDLLGRFAYASRGNTRPGISAAFTSQDGTATGVAARVLAKRLEKPLYVTRVESLLGSNPSESLKNLASAIDLAAAGGAILQIVSVDALYGGNKNEDQSVVVKGLAQKLRSQCGVVIFTGSNGNAFNNGLADPLIDRIDLPFPDAATRVRLWQRAFPKEVPTEDLPFDSMGRLNLSESQICQAGLRAAALAAAEDRPISVVDVKAAMTIELTQTGRSFSTREMDF